MNNAAAYRDGHTATETVNGREYLMSPRPASPQLRTAGNVFRLFANFLRGKRCETFMEPDVFLDEETNVVPDVVIVCDKDKIKYNGIHGAPDLVVEILSPATAARDRGIKKNAYEKAGVKEYWIVDPVAKSIEVYHLREGRIELFDVFLVYPPEEWERMTEEERAKARLSVKVSLYDDLLVDVREVFENVGI